jgi:hypothetical protein
MEITIQRGDCRQGRDEIFRVSCEPKIVVFDAKNKPHLVSPKTHDEWKYFGEGVMPKHWSRGVLKVKNEGKTHMHVLRGILQTTFQPFESLSALIQ